MERAAANQIIEQLLEKVTAVAARVPVEKVKLAIYVVLLLWVVDNLASLVWIAVPQPDATFVATSTSGKAQSTQRQTGQSANISKMQSWKLFGEVDASAAPEVEELNPVATELDGIENDAVKTRLQLSLQGVVASSKPANSRAMIEYQKKQEVYKIGDKLPVGKRVELAKILSDRVILDNGGRYESLLLYDESAIARQAKGAAPKKSGRGDKVIDRRGEERITKMAGDYRKQLLSDPTSLADVIKVSVAKGSDGEVMGYRIRPGKHRKQFSDLGLKSGDIVTEINGITLDNPARALEVYRLLREAQEASFAIKRGDEDVSIIVSLGGD